MNYSVEVSCDPELEILNNYSVQVANSETTQEEKVYSVEVSGGDENTGSGATVSNITITTGSLANGESVTVNETLGMVYTLTKIQVSGPARVRVHTDSVHATADSSRPIGTLPSGDHGVVLEFVSTASLLVAPLSPAPTSFSTGLSPVTITNLGATGPVTVTLTVVVIV